MKIAHGRVSTALAHPDVRLRGLALAPYDAAQHRDVPTLFMGLYAAEDFNAILTHRGPATLMFCGADARGLQPMVANMIAQMHPRVRVLAPKLLADDVRAAGLPVNVVHGVFASDPAPFAPTPLGKRVYAYCPWERAGEYGIDTIVQVAERMPKIDFCIGRWGDHPRPFANALPLGPWTDHANMANVYADCFCSIRTVARDGFPSSPVEMALMGRPTAHVVDVGVPWIEVAPDADAMVAFIEGAMLRSEPDLALARTARAYVSDLSFLDRI